MQDAAEEPVARAIAKVIVTKAVREEHPGLEGLSEIIAINQGVDQIWPSLTEEARAAIAAMRAVQ